MTAPGDTELRQRVRGLLQAAEPPVAPIDSIIRRGRGIRRRRAGAALGCLGLAGIIAAATLLPSPTAPREPVLPVTAPVSGVAGPGGVFASGIADGHAWRLAVQDIADPGYRCIPAITVNGTDADPVYPSPGNSAAAALGAAAPGVGFAFVQVPAAIEALIVDGQESIPAIAATECGLHYRLVGFAFRLAHPPQITAVSARPGWPRRRPTTGSASPAWPADYQLPPVSSRQAATFDSPETVGMWNNEGPASTETARGLVAAGRTWSIAVTLAAEGDCYHVSAPGLAGTPEMDACSPISTPDGPETIMALQLSYPPANLSYPTGYAVQVSPGTAHLRATVSDGSTQLVTPRVVDGRKYAAFIVGTSLRLTRLTWLDAAGRTFASTTALPRFGYRQFQP